MIGKKDIAQRLGVTTVTVMNYVDKGMPGSKRNGVWEFDLSVCKQWVEQYKQPRVRGNEPTLTKTDRDLLDQELIIERTKKIKYEARIKELDMLVAEGRYVDIDEVEQAYAAELTKVRIKLLGLPTKLAPLLLNYDDPKETETILTKEINELLSDFCGE